MRSRQPISRVSSSMARTMPEGSDIPLKARCRTVENALAGTGSVAGVRAVMTERQDLAELGRYAFSRLRDRLAGLTDEEDRWGPAPRGATNAGRPGPPAPPPPAGRNAP